MNVDWVHLSWYKDQQQALINSVMNLCVTQTAGIFQPSKQLQPLSPKEWLFSMELEIHDEIMITN